jgi:peptidoglycan/LPS O-acetylase OafA/YrhL
MRQAPSVYHPAIDGLRAIAVIAVIMFHADFIDILPGGFTGVDMFFVISGYVISKSLHAQGNSSAVDYFGGFYRRRFLRILPALLFVLFISFITSALFIPVSWLSESNDRAGLAAFFGLSNFVLAWNADIYFSPGSELNPYLHTWSLGVEEQFYVIFPVIYFLWLRYKSRVAVVWAVLPLMASISLMISACQTRADPMSAFYLLPGRFWELAAGAILFQVMSIKSFSSSSRKIARLLLPGGFMLVTVGFLFAQRDLFPFPWALATVSGTVLMIAAVTGQDESTASLLKRLLASPLAVYTGRLSYSLYLWHWPVAVFLRWTTGLELLVVQLIYPVIVTSLAAASYHWVETPVRNGTSFLQRRTWIIVVFSILASCLLWLAAQWVSDNSDRLSLSQTSHTYDWYAYRHFPREPIDMIDDPLLEGRQLFVIGDSHTAAYRTLLNTVRLKLGIAVVEYEQGGCGVMTLIGPDPAHCAEQLKVSLKNIEAQAKPGDIVFLASLRMPELDGREWSRGEAAAFNEVLSELTPEKQEHARISAKAVLARLEAARVRILIDAPKPLFKAPPNRCSDWFNNMNPVCASGMTMNRTQLERLRMPQMKLLDLLNREHPDLTVWDPFPVLCPEPTCSAFDKNGKPLFFDSNHLSGHGNRVLEPSFTQVILNIWRGTEPGRNQRSE